jgi:hypothetical protein
MGIKKIFLLIIIILCPQILLGQTTDVLKFYVLFDVSGSVNSLDPNQKSFKLLNHFLESHSRIDNSFSETELHFLVFGDSISTIKPELITELFSDLKSKTFNNIDSRWNTHLSTLDQKFDQYTDLPQAYSYLFKSILKNQNSDSNYTSSGIYIFTDGALEPNDLNVQSGNYQIRNTLANEIAINNSGGIPTFIIQASRDTTNKYFDFEYSNVLRYKPIIENTDSVYSIINDFGFWLYSGIPDDEELEKEFLNAFDQFLGKSRQSVINNAVSVLTSDRYEIIFNISKYIQEEIALNSSSKRNSSLYQPSLLDPKIHRGSYYSENSLKVSSSNNEYITISKKAFPYFYLKNSFGPDTLGQRGNFKSDKYLISINDINDGSFCGQRETKINGCYYLTKAISFVQRLDAQIIDKELIEEITDWYGMVEDNSKMFAEIQNVYREFIIEATSNSDQYTLPANNIELSYKNTLETDFSSNVESKRHSESLEEAIILGLTDYIVKRSKQELYSIYFNSIDETILQRNTFLRDTLFFNLTTTLENSSDLNVSLLQIRKAIENDLQEFVKNLSLSPQAQKTEELLLLNYSIRLIESYTKEKNLITAFVNLKDNQLVENDLKLKKSLQLLIRLIEGYEKYALYSSMNSMDANAQSFASQLILITFADEIKLPSIPNVNEINNNLIELYAELERVQSKVESISNELRNIKVSQDFDAYTRYKNRAIIDIISEVNSLLTFGLELYSNIDPNQNYVSKIFEYQRLSESIADAYFSFSNGQFVNGLNELMPVLQRIKYLQNSPNLFLNYKTKFKTFKNDIEDFENITKKIKYDSTYQNIDNIISLIPSNFESIIKNLYKTTLDDYYQFDQEFINQINALNYSIKDEIKDDIGKVDIIPYLNRISLTKINDIIIEKVPDNSNIYADTLLNVYRKYVLIDTLIVSTKLFNFIAASSEIATTKSAEDVTNLLDKYALPPSSFRIKKEGKRGKFYINSYSSLNLTYRFEKNGLKKGFYPNLNVPIGLELAIPTGPNKNFNLSMFTPLLDVGNMIGVEDSSLVNRKPTIENVFSPGFHFVTSFSRRIPISISTGYQAFPHRLVFNLGIDIPLFRIGN